MNPRRSSASPVRTAGPRCRACPSPNQIYRKSSTQHEQYPDARHPHRPRHGPPGLRVGAQRADRGAGRRGRGIPPPRHRRAAFPYRDRQPGERVPGGAAHRARGLHRGGAHPRAHRAVRQREVPRARPLLHDDAPLAEHLHERVHQQRLDRLPLREPEPQGLLQPARRLPRRGVLRAPRSLRLRAGGPPPGVRHARGPGNAAAVQGCRLQRDEGRDELDLEHAVADPDAGTCSRTPPTTTTRAATPSTSRTSRTRGCASSTARTTTRATRCS